MDKILILLLGLLAVCVAFLVFAYNQKDKLAEKKVKERFACGQQECDDNNGVCADGSSCQENFACPSNGCPSGETCVNDECVDDGQEHYRGYRENFQCPSNGCPSGETCVNDECVDDGQEHYQGYRENFQCPSNGCPSGETCVNDECVDDGQEHYQGYRENFACPSNGCPSGETCVNDECVDDGQEHFMSDNCEGCPGASDCGQRGCPTAEQFCGTGSCFQEGFRSGSLNRSYRKPAGQEFFQGYGIESFSNGGNYNELNENFEEESNGEEHYQNYVREDFESQPATLKLFYADWCGHCKRFKPTFENELPRAIRNSGLGCKLVAINADEQPDLVRRYNVKGFPTMILERNCRLIEYNGDRTVSDIERFISKNL
jgi:thiol-disulfide isomerase/thioredoxin